MSSVLQVMLLLLLPLVQGLHLEKKLKCSIKFNFKVSYHFPKINSTNITLFILDDVEFEVSSDRRTGKPIAVKLVKIKQEILPEERINGQVSGFDAFYFLRALNLHIFHIRKGRLTPSPQFARKRAIVYKSYYFKIISEALAFLDLK